MIPRGPSVMNNPGTALPYRRCVGILVINNDGLVWTGRRRTEPGDELSNSSQLWQLPQGGIDPGEDHELAARRELFEETGICSVTLLGESSGWIHYDLPQELVGIALKGKYRGQKQKWYAYRFEGDEAEIRINPPPDGHKPEFDEWCWRPLRELPQIVVTFKKQLYEKVVAEFSHLAEPRQQ
jgi:putative (di)nucleoside polyphosphate hydrolase